MAEETTTSEYLQLVMDGRGNIMEMLEDDDDDSNDGAGYNADDPGLTKEMMTYMDNCYDLAKLCTSNVQKDDRSVKDKKNIKKYGKKVAKYRKANPDLALYLDHVWQDKIFNNVAPTGRTYPGMVLRGVPISWAMDKSPSVAKFMKFVKKTKKDKANGVKKPRIKLSATPEEFAAREKKEAKAEKGKKKKAGKKN